MKCWCGGRVSTQGVPPTDELHCLESPFHDPVATGKPDHVDRLYISGPMSGLPECNYPAFYHAADVLRDHGYLVTNPAEYGSNGKHYVDLLRDDLKAMLDCHGVVMLEGWWESAGARTEVQVAGLLRMPCRTLEAWSARAVFELGHLKEVHD